MLNIHIEQITHELTWQLRQQVLYPGNAITDMAMSGDEDGIHYGAFFENKLIAIISTFRKDNNIQISKFTVQSALQRQGIGSALLQYITGRAAESGATRIWCNARTPAAHFYLKAGFELAGETFTRSGIDYVIMHKQL